MEIVKIRKKRIFIDNGELYLESFDLDSIKDIKGLKRCRNLKAIYLEKNNISELE